MDFDSLNTYVAVSKLLGPLEIVQDRLGVKIVRHVACDRLLTRVVQRDLHLRVRQLLNLHNFLDQASLPL